MAGKRSSSTGRCCCSRREGRPRDPAKGRADEPAELCIRRPVMTSLLMLSFIVFGLFGTATSGLGAARVDFRIRSTPRCPARVPTRWPPPSPPAGARVRDHPGINMMTSSSSLGRRRSSCSSSWSATSTGRASTCSRTSPPLCASCADAAGAAELSEDQPGRLTILFIGLLSKTLR